MTTGEYYLADAMGRTVAIKDLQHNSWEYYVSTNERDARLKPGTTNGARFSEEEAQFFVYDHLGNTRITYTPMQVAGTYTINRIDYAADYYPYGKKMPGRSYFSSSYEGYRYQFTGHEQDGETGYQYHGARYYNEELGKYMSVDPLAVQFASYSTYNYVMGNPLVLIDPDGRAAEDFVMRQNGTIYWDKNANSQATTKEGETYLGKTLTFEFNSYIDGANWDGPNPPVGPSPIGDKLTSTITIKATENDAGELTGLDATKKVKIGSTPYGTARDYYPGLGADQNKFSFNQSLNTNGTLNTYNLNFEQHASVSPVEEYGMRYEGYNIVNVAQKLNLYYSGGNLSVSSFTDIFPSATLKVNGIQMMYYKQPSFVKTHSLPIKGYSPPSMKDNTVGGRPIYNYSYKKAFWYKR